MDNNGFLYHFPPERYPLDLCDRLFQDSHILIGGTNGSGKSVLINNIMYNLISKRAYFANDPESVSFVLIDPKRVELYKYIELPHTIGYACENDQIIEYLKRVVVTMERRYEKMREKGITLYDGCYIVVVIDELADLMTTCKKEVMPLLQRIAQLGRAAKIKLIAATQAPNRKVIPAELILNFTGRVALRCLSPIESRQILNLTGAELLPRYGQCLYLNNNGEFSRENISMIPAEEITKSIDFITKQKKGNALIEFIKANKTSTKNKKFDTPLFIAYLIALFVALAFLYKFVL